VVQQAETGLVVVVVVAMLPVGCSCGCRRGIQARLSCGGLCLWGPGARGGVCGGSRVVVWQPLLMQDKSRVVVWQPLLTRVGAGLSCGSGCTCS
jgi:hypothetical protein